MNTAPQPAPGSTPLPTAAIEAAIERATEASNYFRRSWSALAQREPVLLEEASRLIGETLGPHTATRAWERVLTHAPTGSVARDPARALRQTRQLLMLAMIARDVAGLAPLEEIMHTVSAWAEQATAIALRHLAAELAAQYGVPLDDEGKPQDLLVVGMGKLGGHELNVSSDLDVVYVFRSEGETAGGPGTGRTLAASEFFHRLAQRLNKMLSNVTEDGFVFRVDTRLRPNGDSGPLVVTLSMLEKYFYEQGREWERFAWLKGRVIADSGLAGSQSRDSDEAALNEIVQPFVFRRYLDFAAIESLRDLHGLIRAEVGRRDSRTDLRQDGGSDVKLGRGGIREVEFCAQLFQIVRGGRDPALRDKRTLATLSHLAERRLLEAQAVEGLSQAYRLLRRIEHALQYLDDAQTHWLPGDSQVRARVAHMLGLSVEAFEAGFEQARRHVESIFGGLLEDPRRRADSARQPTPAQATAGGQTATPGTGPQAGASPTGGPGGASGTGTGAAAAMATPPAGAGHDGPLRAAREARLTALREGRRYRTARPETQRRIETLIERALASGPVVPAQGEDWLGRLLDLLETVAGRPAYLALLEQFPGAFERLLTMLAQAKWAADYLSRHPVVLDELLDGQILEPASLARWEEDLAKSLAATTRGGEPDLERQMDMLREAHHAQVFRLLAQDLGGRLTVEGLSDELSELADRVIALSLDRAWRQLRQAHRDTPRFAVIAYGKLGGKELGYASDLDLVFLFEDDDERAQPVYTLLAQRLSGWLSTRTAAGVLFETDLRLRPNGAAGLPVSSLRAFETYQRESAWVWEHQALTRARFSCGDRALGERFEAIRREILSLERDPEALAGEVRAMRRKMLDGHPNASGDFDLKHDPGGMVDIEFLVQFLVLAHARRHPGLLDNAGNIALLRRAADAGLIDEALAASAAQAYRDYRRLQHSLRLNDARYARVAPESVAAARAGVITLWNSVLGPY